MKSFILPKIAGPACESGILGRKLSNIYVSGEQHGITTDIQANYNLTWSGTPSNSVNFGYRNISSTSTSNKSSGKAKAVANYPIVFVAVGYMNSAAAANQIIDFTPASPNGYLGSISIATSSTLKYTFRINYGTTISVTSPSLGTATNKVVACIGQSLSATDHRFYCNGLSASSSTSAGAFSAAFNTISLPGRTANDSGTILAGVGSIPFTDAEAILLTSHPELMIAEIINSRNIVHLNSGSGTTFNITPSGSIVFSGSVTQNHEHIQSTSGSIIFSGTNNQVHEKNIVPTGSVVFSGGSSIIYTPSGGTTYTITPNGTITFNGTVLQNHEHILNTSGNIVFSGSIDTIKTKVVTPTGNIIFSGTAPITIPGSGPEPTTKLPLTGIGV